jgi:serine/threonine protein kinase
MLYKTQQEQKKIIARAEEQKAIINELKQLLLDSSGAPTQLREAGVNEETPTRADDETAIGDNPRNRTVLPRTEHNAGELLSRRYKILQQLGKGGFGITYLAEDTKRPGNPQCVVKHLMLAHRDEQVLKVARRLFRSEADILEKLRHPQIPKLLAFFEENQEFYIVQEFIDGHPLSRELPVNQPLPESFVVALLQEVLEILAFIHNCNVIHRDLKPDNIIRREKDTRLVLIDFGAVKYILPQDNPVQGSFTVPIGTRGYAPPEQFAGQPNFSSDIYALGMIGIQALTGKAPKELTVDMNTGNISWREFAPPVREEFAQILDKMVRYRYPDRYQSAAAVLEDLQRL